VSISRQGIDYRRQLRYDVLMVDYGSPGGRPSTDVFCCGNRGCRSFLVLTTWSDGALNARAQRFGGACDVCANVTAASLKAVMADVTRLGHAGPVAQPTATSRTETQPSPPDDAERVTFVRDLIGDGSCAAISNVVAARAADLARRHLDRVSATKGSTVINAIAKGIESIDQNVSKGIAWVVTGITDMPEFPARVLGSLITSTILPPVAALATGLRVFGAVCSGIAGSLDRCACMRDLATKYIFEQPIAEISRNLLDRFPELDSPRPPDLDDPPPPPRLPGLSGL